jgi:uncharacterized protein YjbI with pentapeptide repeats
MKASEVLKKYAAGERNFQRLNLRGQSFKGKNLARADFSEADIRSTNFTGANLKDANFTGAKCGLQRRWVILLIIFSWLLIGMSALFFLLAVGYLVSLFFDSSGLEAQMTGWIIPMILVSFLILMIFQGIRAGAGTIAGVVTGTTVGAFTVAGVVAIFVVGAYATAFIIILGAKTFVVEGFVRIVVIILTGVIILAGVGTIAVAGTVAYFSWCSLRGDKKAKDVLLRPYILAFIAIRGTSFRGANLSNANFTGARLKSTDFRKANLTRVCWYGAKMLDRVRPGDTYLKSTQVRQWLFGKGIDNNFDGQKLQGINFQGADLTDASFIDANLSEANLQDANLSRAKLIRSQLDRTDFTGVTLTGAFIEDWGITTNTKLDDVMCEYVFMRSPTAENPNPHRKPDNWEEVFEGNDFADFIKPIFDTLDLYHNQGVDPRAIAISWKQLAENHPDAELQLASMEVKGKDNLLLRLKTAPKADKSRLNAEYFETYNQIKALTAAESQKLIAEKDNRIQALESMVNTALKRPGFYAQNYNHQGDNEMAGEHRNIEIDQGNYNEKIEGNYTEGNSYSITGDNNQAVQGDNNQTTQQNQADTDTREQITQAEVIKLLAELEQKIVSSELSEETKQKTLNRLVNVSDDVQEKEPDKELVKGNFKKVTETLAQASKSTEEAKKLWDNVQPILKTLAKWLGVGIQFF